MRGPRAWLPHHLLGVVLAGGESRRYGRPKALALMGGRPMALWALDALGPSFPLRGMVGSDLFVSRGFGVPSRPDILPGLGPMGGLITALEWAKEMRLMGVFLLGCDMPLIDASLIQRILAFRGDRNAALVPASHGPLGMEPLCAAYGMECLGPARELTRSGPRSMMALLNTVDFDLLPMEELGEPEEVSMVFTNVNTAEDGKKVEAALEARRENADGEVSPGPETF